MLFSRFTIKAGILVWMLSRAATYSGPVPNGKPSNYPDWWFERDVIPRLSSSANNLNPIWPANYPLADDYAVANIGQLKYFALKAGDELSATHGLNSQLITLLKPFAMP